MMATMYQSRIVVLTTIAAACYVLPGYAQTTGQLQPTNITRYVGDRNVYVPCPFVGPAAVTWRIGDQFYSQSALPEPYTYVPGGLIIERITSNMSGLSFQCFTPLNYGLYDTESNTGVLTVKPNLLTDENFNEPSYTPFRPEPTNITVDIQERNIFIPCPFGGPAIHTWKIGDHFYTSTTLPQYYHPTVGGLIISSLQSNMSGLTFQCFSPNGIGLYVDRSTVGTLTITDNRDEVISWDRRSLTGEHGDFSPMINPGLYFDYQKFWFTNASVTFAWKYRGQPCNPNTTFFINSTECVVSHQPPNTTKPYYSMEVMKKNVTISRSYLIDKTKKNILFYFLISVGSSPNSDICDNLELPTYITVKGGVITESRSTTPYDRFCINMPSASISKGALRFILTYRNVSDPTGRDQLDLACLAECDTNTIMRNGNCILHDKCSPVQMEDTIYSGIVTLSQKNNTHMFELCFSNPPIEINETKIHIYYERSCTNTLTSRPIPIAEYVKAVVMNITVPPSQPNVTVSSTSGEICIIPQTNEIFSADYYKIGITDITGYEIFKNESVVTPCITVNSLLQYECAPFNISIVGHNLYGDSYPIFHVVEGGFDLSNWCKCANMKVNSTLTFIPHAQSVQYNYACNVSKEFDADLESTILFVIHLIGDRYNTNTSLQLCSTESGTSTLNGLDCGSAYNFTVHFAHPNGSISDCPVQNSNFEVKTSNPHLDFSCPKQHQTLIIVTTVLLPLLVIIFIVAVIILSGCLCYKKKRCCCRPKNTDRYNIIPGSGSK